MKRTVRKVSRKPVAKKRPSESKFRMVVRNLILFAVLFIISYMLFSVAGQEIYINLFFMLSLIFGFVALAFLIAFLIFLFRRILKK